MCIRDRVTSLIFPVFFQAVGAAVKSSLLTVVRTVVLFVPLGYLFSRLGPVSYTHLKSCGWGQSRYDHPDQ